MNFGIPYMGSKSKICEKVCALFPKSDNFYDLFGGGFSITHFMIKHRSKHFKKFHFNEIRPGVCDLIKDAIAGKYSYDNFKPPWVSREDFSRLLDTDPYIKIIWSFGNNGKTYLFGKDIEQNKKSMHMAIVFNQFDDYAKKIFGVDRFAEGLSITAKRLYLKNKIKTLGKDRLDLQQLERLEQLQQLQQLERLEQLQQLQQLERLEQLQQLEWLERLYFYSGDYESVPIKENSVIYCDIPYRGTAEYDENKNFSHKEFYEWAHTQSNPVFISEYTLPDSRFKCIANFQKRSLLCSDKSIGNKTEKVFVNHAGYKALMTRKV
ncbi:MAG: DNA adenine methylase [Dolichospermum sp.]|nr:DNA adenine methylase [Dolichospermum sp.]